MKPPITQQHLAIAQEIIEFLQSRGWDVNSIDIARQKAWLDDTEEEWKERGPAWRWQLTLRTEPRDQDELIKVKEQQS